MQADRPLKKAKKKRPVEVPALEDKGVKPRTDARTPETRMAPIFTIIGRWLDEPQPILRLELIRILAPLATLGFMSSRLAHADEWLTNVGFQVPEIIGGDYRQPLYLSPLSTTSAWLLAVVMVASGLAVSAGFRARLAALVFAATLIYVGLADRLASFTVTKLSPGVMLALAASPVGTRFGVDAWLRRKKDPDAPMPDLVAGGAVRFFQLLLPVFYAGSAIAKAHGDWLSHPHVLWTHIHDSYQTGVSWLLANSVPGWLWTVLQGVVFSLEAGAPIWFAYRGTRNVALVAAVGMHVMIALMFWPVRWFALLMITMWLGAYLPEAWMTRAAAKITRA